MNMNTYDVQQAFEQCKGHPVLGPATTFLKALVDYTNENSDGWHSWPKPSRASDKLQQFIKANTNVHYMPNRGDNCKLDEFKKTLSPIKAMCTREQKKYRSTWGFDVDWNLERALDKPAPTVPSTISRGVTEFKIWRISASTGDFGHHQFFLTAKTGATFKVHRHQSGTGREPWKMFEVVRVSYVGDDYQWAEHDVECPERLEPNAPPDVVDLIWSEKIHEKQPQVTGV